MTRAPRNQCDPLGWSTRPRKEGPVARVPSHLGFSKGLVTVDPGYSQQLPENFRFPGCALGDGLTMMYRKDDRGLHDLYEGALLVDGNWYGACLPCQYIDQASDLSDNRITEATYV